MKLKSARRMRKFLLYLALLSAMAYSTLALTTEPVRASCFDCGDTESINALGQGVCPMQCFWVDFVEIVECTPDYVIYACTATCNAYVSCQ